jgi:hypothetical protein
MSEVMAGTVHNLGPVDLSVVYDSISRDKGRLLRTTAESVDRSYATGMAAVLVDRDYPQTAVGYVRFVPLMPHQIHDSLERAIGMDYHVFETGTAHIVPTHRRREYQGRGYYPLLRRALYDQHRSELHRGTLVIGTTKNRRVIKSLHVLRDELPGLDYEVCTHDKYPGIKALTCVCTGSFGHGVQYWGECSRRIPDRDVIQLVQSAEHHGHDQYGDDISCTMYVSSSDLAQRISDSLVDHFALPVLGQGYRRLVGKLKELGHFD